MSAPKTNGTWRKMSAIAAIVAITITILGIVFAVAVSARNVQINTQNIEEEAKCNVQQGEDINEVEKAVVRMEVRFDGVDDSLDRIEEKLDN